jgi:hypothetical protein
MTSLLQVENGWDANRFYFHDTKEGMVKARQKIREQKDINRAKKSVVGDPNEVFLSRLRPEQNEEGIFYSDSDDSSDDNSDDEGADEQEEHDEEGDRNEEVDH